MPRDAEAHGFWLAHVRADRILELGAKDNFWAMGETGPLRSVLRDPLLPGRRAALRRGGGGPRRAWASSASATAGSRSGTSCSCSSTATRRASSIPLPAPCVDTGMGLERDHRRSCRASSRTTTPISSSRIIAGRRAAGGHVATGASAEGDVSLRVVADHLRATTFLIGDGVHARQRGPRLRAAQDHAARACATARKLGIEEPFLHELVSVVVERMARRLPGAAHAGGVRRARRESGGGALRVDAASRRWSEFGKTVGEAAPRGQGRASSPARTPSASTTPTACPSTSWRSWPRTTS